MKKLEQVSLNSIINCMVQKESPKSIVLDSITDDKFKENRRTKGQIRTPIFVVP